MDIFPNVVIAGAPKCGSTSLFYYLDAHPSVCASSIQESRYLIDETYPLYNENVNVKKQGINGYAQFFTHFERDKHSIIMDCTPDYMYQETSVKYLSTLKSKPTIIFILRDPAQRVYSLFQYARNNVLALDRKFSFRQFIDMIKLGENGSFSKKEILLNAINHGKYIDYISKWEQSFGINKFVIIIFEDLIKNPKNTMFWLANTLGIGSEFYESYSFEVKNMTVSIRYPFVHKLTRAMSQINPLSLKLYKFKKIYQKLNSSTKEIEKTDEDKNLVNLLRDEFRESNLKLAEKFDLNISAWLNT